MVDKTLGIRHNCLYLGPIPVDETGAELDQLESLSKVFYCSVGIKTLAGKNIYVNVVLLNKGVNANMTLRYENKS